ncbi:MAG: transglycosylase SLT domain-containing protein [Thermodesulfovibrionia bacterium]|nr:transglycosylase SLT domain-containing protein [Thermodesulfovibrionia bacterium]
MVKLTSTILTVIIFMTAGYCSAREQALNSQAMRGTGTQHIIPKLPADKRAGSNFLYFQLVTDLKANAINSADTITSLSNSYPITLRLELERIRRMTIEYLFETYGFNKAVKKRIYMYSKKSKHDFRKNLHRAGKYLDAMSQIFREKNLPQELVFLPLIESGFRLNAYSHKKAAGPWQFIPRTAKTFGLKIDWWVDERLDPIKSTRAAAEYLRKLYKIFGSWNLVLAAYNAGEGNILRALRKTKSNDFWALRKTRHIVNETKNYVPSYIAAAAIALHPESFGLQNITYHRPLSYDEVVIDMPMDLTVIAEFTGSDPSDIKELNPELRRWCTPPNVSHYTLRIPVGTKEKFIANVSNARKEKLLYVEFYTVKKGDTVWKIAQQFDVPKQAIIDFNALNKKGFIVAGKKILIPYKRSAVIIGKNDETTRTRLRPILKSNPSKNSI